MPVWMIAALAAGVLVLALAARAVRGKVLDARTNRRMWQNACAQLQVYLDEGYSRDEVAIVSEHGIPVARIISE